MFKHSIFGLLVASAATLAAGTAAAEEITVAPTSDACTPIGAADPDGENLCSGTGQDTGIRCRIAFPQLVDIKRVDVAVRHRNPTAAVVCQFRGRANGRLTFGPFEGDTGIGRSRDVIIDTPSTDHNQTQLLDVTCRIPKSASSIRNNCVKRITVVTED